jgi:hypothetical protein
MIPPPRTSRSSSILIIIIINIINVVIPMTIGVIVIQRCARIISIVVVILVKIGFCIIKFWLETLIRSFQSLILIMTLQHFR